MGPCPPYGKSWIRPCYSWFFWHHAGRLSRPLGTGEVNCHNFLLDFNEMSTARALGLEAKSGFTLQNEDITQALSHLKARHASLQVCIQKHDGQLWFVPYHGESEIPFYEKNCSDWVNEIENSLCEHSTFEGQLLWKVTRVNSNESNNGSVILIFAIHHAIMDGLSMSNLMIELADILNEVASANVPSV